MMRKPCLIEILKTNIFGIDVNETACRIAAFSLYLALLDQLSPRDIRNLQARGKALPKLVLADGEQADDPQSRTIFQKSFFSREIPLPLGGFDLIVGNPPWAKENSDDPRMSAWCKEEKLPIAQKQVAYGFAWKAPYHLREGGRVCFLLPAALILNHQKKSLQFQEKFFQSHQVAQIVNLGDMSFYLFDKADRPAIIMRYRGGEADSKSRIEYLTPKTTYETLQAEILAFHPEDRSSISLSELLGDLTHHHAPLAWKKHLWGTPRDRKFLDRLECFPSLGVRTEDGSAWGWVFGEGFNTGGDGPPVDRPILHQLPFLPTDAVAEYVISESSLQPKPPVYNPRRLGKEEIFRSPHVLLKHGVSRKGHRLRVGFSGFDCSFEHSVRGIHAPSHYEDMLRLLTCALSSRLALYFFFHTAANWGTERAKIHVDEYNRFPIPEPDTPERRSILAEVASLHREMEADVDEFPLFSGSRLEDRISRIDQLVCT